MADKENKRYIFPDSAENPLDSIAGIGSNFFTGHEDTATQVLTYQVTGFSVIKWIKLPGWFEEDPDLKYFGTLTEKVFRSFQGIGDITLQMQQTTVGYNAREVNFAGQVAVGNSEFQMEFDEYSGSVITKMFMKWIGLIRDPNTGIATYPTLYPNYEYSDKNHSGELLYVMLRPDVNNTKVNNIEGAIFYTHVIPTNIPLSSSLNYSRGTSNGVQLSVSFNGFAYIGPKVEEYARKVLREQILNVGENSDGLLFNNTFDTKDGGEHMAVGTLAEIYGDKED